MKIKLTSLLLILSFILSLFTVYSFASENVNEVNDDAASEYLYYKNSFGDDADDVGGNLKLLNAVNSVFEAHTEANGNHYGYYNFNDSDKNVYFQLNAKDESNINTGMYLIFEMDFNDLGNLLTTDRFLDINSGTGTWNSTKFASQNVLNIANDSNGNYFYFNGSKTQKIYIPSNEWVHIRCEFSPISSTASTYKLRCYIGDEYFEASSYKLGTPKIISELRIGSTKTTNQIMGLDNLLFYTTKDRNSMPFMSTLSMKIGAENAKLNSQQIELENVPLLINDDIYCPLDIIEEVTNKTCPENYVVTIDDSRYIHVDNIFYAFGVATKVFKDMGLIQIGTTQYTLQDDASYEDIMKLMKTFVFNLPTETDILNAVSNNTNNYTHPYLLADADRFSELKAIYNAGKAGTLKTDEEKQLYAYISKYIDSAISNLDTYCGIKENGNYNGILSSKIPVNNNYKSYNNNGYDNGGRTTINTGPLTYFAFAYQITGNLNYARAAYDFMIYLGNWNHWGPDHFLNTADAAAPFSIAYDWMYDAFETLNAKGEIAKSDGEIYDKSKLATILFRQVIIPGYVQSNNIACPWPGTANSRYAKTTNNWNAVCTSGVAMAALMLLNEDVSTAGMTFNTQKKSGSTYTNTVTPIESIGNTSIHVGLSTYSDYAAKIISMNLASLVEYGLGEYAPDGSYIESPSYWAYGTNAYFRLAASLLSVAGDDFGLMDCWGIDMTCYFAVHSESSDYKTWNFNDGSVGVQDSSFFFFVGDYYGDDNLVKIRKKHLSDGKNYTLYDILFYDVEITGEPTLTLDYHMVGIDAYSFRSSWNKGAAYTGIIGGLNNCSHGQIDAGSFVYHNNGKIWFHDLGADNYNIVYKNASGTTKKYFGNYDLYRLSSEGHNVISIVGEDDTLPYGQLTNANPHIIDSCTTNDGGYAVLDMSASYGSHVTSAKRGLLFTNSRNTTVIQDEYEFNGAKTVYWFGHYNVDSGYVDNVLLSADGRTAFMVSGSDIIRVSIVSDNADLKFEIMDAYTYVLDATNRTDRTTMDGSATEKNRDSIKKLAIKCENVTSLNLAVVIEEVDAYEIGTLYDYTSIEDWRVTSNESLIIDNKFEADFNTGANNIGSYKMDSANDGYRIENFKTSSQSYIGILPNSITANCSDSIFTLYFKNNNPIILSETQYITFDFDVFTEGMFIDNAAWGVNVTGFDGKREFISLLTFRDNKIVSDGKELALQNSFKHLTVVISSKDGSIWVYIDNTFFTQISGAIDSKVEQISTFELLLPAQSSVSNTGSILLDNLCVRAFGNGYDATALYTLLSSEDSISYWPDSVTYQNISIPLALANNKELYTNTEIENAIKSGYSVTLLRDITGLINVSGEVTVNTNGYRFKYISDQYIARIYGDEILFSTGTITVIWHIGDDIITEKYTESKIATFKETSNQVDKITFTKTDNNNGGVVYKFYTTGWAKSPGGAVLSDADMVVSHDNCEFWLVNNVPLDCMFVKIDSTGKVTPFYNEADLSKAIKENNRAYNVVLCQDVEILSNSTQLTGGNKLYLNGYTLYYNQYDNHMFNFPVNAADNFYFIGPGTLETVDARTIFTSSGSNTSTTVKYGIVATNVNFVTNTQFGDLRIGQHKFINCSVYHSGGKVLLALWNKNPSFGEAGVPLNHLTVTFENCLITSNATSSYGIFSYSGSSYSEIYLVDTKVVTNACLIASAGTIFKFSASGSTSIIAERVLTDASLYCQQILFDNGVITNMQLADIYLKTGSSITNNYDSNLPYRVSNKTAKVIWKTLDGDIIATDIAAVGVTPDIISHEVLSYLNSIGSDYIYELQEITDTSDVILLPVLKTKSTIFQSMTIENDLTMNLYIQKYEIDNTILSVKVDGTRIMKNSYQIEEIDGESYYKYSILTFVPAKAFKDIDIVIEYTDGTIKTITTSAVKYLEKWLSLSNDDNEKILAVKLLKYIKDACSYFNKSSAFEEKKIDLIIDQYKEYDIIFGSAKDESVDTSNMSHAVKSVCFNLSASVRIRFYLNSGYTGQLSIEFDDEVTEYYIYCGLTKKSDYIEVLMPANLINQKITISDGVNSISYGLNAYVTDTNNVDYNLQQMLTSLAEYSSAAEQYVNSKSKS